MEGKSCRNCGYVERVDKRLKHPQMYCSCLESEHCSEWVTDKDVCPKWIAFNASTKYYFG